MLRMPLPAPLIPSFSQGMISGHHWPGEQLEIDTTTDAQKGKLRWAEITAACSILALIAALVLPTLNSRALALPSATQHLISTLRLARDGAISRGTHVRVTINYDFYLVEQLQDHDGNGVWNPDSTIPAWRVLLPPSVSIKTGAGVIIDFDSRGEVASLAPPTSEILVQIQLIDSYSGKSGAIHILASGKVQEA
jgi:hypothetical protein